MPAEKETVTAAHCNYCIFRDCCCKSVFYFWRCSGSGSYPFSFSAEMCCRLCFARSEWSCLHCWVVGDWLPEAAMTHLDPLADPGSPQRIWSSDYSAESGWAEALSTTLRSNSSISVDWHWAISSADQHWSVQTKTVWADRIVRDANRQGSNSRHRYCKQCWWQRYCFGRMILVLDNRRE